MANLNKLVQGEIRITYQKGPDIILPVRFYAPDLWEAEKVFIRQAIADLIVQESSALENARSVSQEAISIEM